MLLRYTWKTCCSLQFPPYLLAELGRVAWVDTMENFLSTLSVTRRQLCTEVILEMHLKGTHHIQPGSWDFWRLLWMAVFSTFSVLSWAGSKLQMVFWFFIVMPFEFSWQNLCYIRFFHVSCDFSNNVYFPILAFYSQAWFLASISFIHIIFVPL